MQTPPIGRKSLLKSLHGLVKSSGAVAAAIAVFGFLLSASALLAYPGPSGVDLGLLDWLNMTNGITAWAPLSGNSVPVDSSGWPTSDFQALIFDYRKNGPNDGPDALGINEDLAGLYSISFTGQATVTDGYDPVTVNVSYNSQSNATSGTLLLAPGNNRIILNFTNTKRLPTDPTGTGITNLVITPPGASANHNPYFIDNMISDLSINGRFSDIRYNGLDGLINYPAFCPSSPTLCVTTWAARVLATQALQPQAGMTLPGQSGPTGYGIAWEYMIDLANAANTDMWINIPVSADDDYVTQLATLIKSNLNSNLNVYVEYSNEVWNSAFPQYTYVNFVAQQQSPALSNLQQYVKRSIEVAKDFESAFGVSNGQGRVRPVLEYQEFQYVLMFNALQWWQQQNDDIVGNYIYGVGDAPYFGSTDTSTITSTFNGMYMADGITSRTTAIGWSAVANYYGLNLTGYESGPSSLRSVNMGYVLRDPRMQAAFYYQYLNDWYAVGGGLIDYEQMQGFVNPDQYYMLLEDYDHPGAVEWNAFLGLNGQPLQTPNAGNVLPWALNQTAVIDPSQYAGTALPPNMGFTLSTGGTYFYLLRTNTNGNSYGISLSGCEASSGSAAVDVYIDNALIGALNCPTGSPGTSGTLNTGVVSRYPLETLSLVASGGTSTFSAGTGAIGIVNTRSEGSALAPSAPSNVTAISGDTQVTLNWAATSTATTYDVERSTTSGSGFTQIASGLSANSYTDAALTQDKTYYYTISATNSVGTGAPSEQIAAFTAAATPSGPPSSLKGAAGASTLTAGGPSNPYRANVLLSWAPVADASGYTISRTCTDVNTNQVVLAGPGSPGERAQQFSGTKYSGSQFTDSAYLYGQCEGPFAGLDIGNNNQPYSYTYEVTACNDQGCEATPASVTVTPEQGAPQAPVLTWARNDGYSFFYWTGDALNPGNFTLSRSTNASGPFTPIVGVATQNTFDFTAVPNTNYYYQVTDSNQTCSSNHDCPISNVVSGSSTVQGYDPTGQNLDGYGSGSPAIPWVYPGWPPGVQ